MLAWVKERVVIMEDQHEAIFCVRVIDGELKRDIGPDVLLRYIEETVGRPTELKRVVRQQVVV